MTNSLHVALTFDDNFWAPAYAVMRSICLTTRRRSDLVFHLLHMPLSHEHRSDIEKITAEFGAEIIFYPLVDLPVFLAFVADLPSSSQWPKIVYARMLLPVLLPKDIKRVIYLDCDMLVRWPVEKLYEIDLEGHPLGAVKDSLAPFIALRRDMRQNSNIFDAADPYFNSGVLVMDLEQWRQLDIKTKIAELAQKGLMKQLYFDQDMLNLIFRGQWRQLPWRWNTIDAQHAHEALDPAILHYTREIKPWALLAGIRRSAAYARWYRHVMTNELFYRFMRHRWKRWWLKLLRFG